MKLQVKAVSPLIGTKIPYPSYATAGSAAMDLHACIEEPLLIPAGQRRVIPSGIAIALPSADYVALLFARSGLGIKKGICLSNGVGVIDSDYRGEISIALSNTSEEDYTVLPGDRICQMMITPAVQVEILPTDTLGDTDRGVGGIGSTGR